MREWVEFEPVFAAVSRLSAEHPDIRILIVGEEGGLGKTMNSARKFDVLNKTVFAGTVPYKLVPEYISCMDVCLIPFAKHKGMDAGEDGYCPLKLAEYLACEKPVISTQKTSMPEGIVAYASTAEEYYDRILMLYNNPQLRFEMGSQGRKIIQSSYTWLNSASMLEKVLTEAAS
jgi:glycosyltransferase involved in cell wall biosynthesis